MKKEEKGGNPNKYKGDDEEEERKDRQIEKGKTQKKEKQIEKPHKIPTRKSYRVRCTLKKQKEKVALQKKWNNERNRKNRQKAQ